MRHERKTRHAVMTEEAKERLRDFNVASEYRKEVAEKVGLGFVIPTEKVVVVPNVRRKSVKVEVAVAA